MSAIAWDAFGLIPMLADQIIDSQIMRTQNDKTRHLYTPEENRLPLVTAVPSNQPT